MDKPQRRTTNVRTERRRLPDGRPVFLHWLYEEGEKWPCAYIRQVEGEKAQTFPIKPPPEELH